MGIQAEVILNVQTVRRAERRAEQLGLSIAEYIDAIVSRDLAPEPQRRRVDPSILFDLGSSAVTTDIARDKDRMIEDAVLAHAEAERTL